jgi:hypothetical protein
VLQVVVKLSTPRLSDRRADCTDLTKEYMRTPNEISRVTHRIRSSSVFNLRYTRLPLSCSMHSSAVRRIASISSLLGCMPPSWVSRDIEMNECQSVLQTRDLKSSSVLHIFSHMRFLSISSDYPRQSTRIYM